MTVINATVGKYSKEVSLSSNLLGYAGEDIDKSILFTFDHHVNNFGIIEITKPSSTKYESKTYIYSLTNTGSAYTWTVPDALLDVPCELSIVLIVTNLGVEVFRSNPFLMYIDYTGLDSRMNTAEDKIETLETELSTAEEKIEVIEGMLPYKWQDWTPVLTWATADPETPTVVARYVLNGGVCSFALEIKSTDSNGTTGLTISLPKYRAENGLKDIFYSNVADYQGFVYADDTAQLFKFGNFGSPVDGEPLEIYITGIYAVGSDLTDYKVALAAVSEEDYTVASWTAYGLILADYVVTTANEQSEVDAATTAISEAQADLVFAGQADLDAAKAAEALLNPEDYVDYSGVAAALALPETTNAEVVTKTSAITDAIAALVEA